jgi:3-mercaptopyruvate sulfurtransferase SseA
LVFDEEGLIKDDNELKSLFNEAGVDTTLQTIIIGDDSGHSASIVELALRIIGAE